MKTIPERRALGWLRARVLGSGKTVVGFTVLLALAVGVIAVRADTLVLPQWTENAEGSNGLDYPFDPGSGGGDFSRLQVILDDTLFNTVGPGLRISEIAFRADGGVAFGGSFDVTFDGIEVKMSTTSPEPESISDRFSDNIGLDETVAMNRVPVQWSTTVMPGQVNPFSLRLPLSMPYEYFPANGNLLIDIKVFGRVRTESIDADGRLGLSGSAWATRDEATGDSNRRIMPVIRIDFEVIPEPPSGILLIVGLGVIIAWKKLRN